MTTTSASAAWSPPQLVQSLAAQLSSAATVVHPFPVLARMLKIHFPSLIAEDIRFAGDKG